MPINNGIASSSQGKPMIVVGTKLRNCTLKHTHCYHHLAITSYCLESCWSESLFSLIVSFESKEEHHGYQVAFSSNKDQNPEHAFHCAVQDNSDIKNFSRLDNRDDICSILARQTHLKTQALVFFTAHSEGSLTWTIRRKRILRSPDTPEARFSQRLPKHVYISNWSNIYPRPRKCYLFNGPYAGICSFGRAKRAFCRQDFQRPMTDFGTRLLALIGYEEPTHNHLIERRHRMDSLTPHFQTCHNSLNRIRASYANPALSDWMSIIGDILRDCLQLTGQQQPWRNSAHAYLHEVPSFPRCHHVHINYPNCQSVNIGGK